MWETEFDLQPEKRGRVAVDSNCTARVNFSEQVDDAVLAQMRTECALHNLAKYRKKEVLKMRLRAHYTAQHS